MLRALLVPLIGALATTSFAGVAPCVQRSGGAIQEPPTLDALLDCQQKALAAYQSAHPDLSDDDVDGLQEAQEAEARDYLQRHPERAGGGASEDDTPSPRTAAPAKAAASSSTPTASGLSDLKAQLQAESDGGKNGLTPEMAQTIAAFLEKSQGGMSEDMSSLLDSLQKDGPNLSDQSVLRLKQAARQAKSQGLDLGIDPKMEQWLLNPATDPKVGLSPAPSN